ncbi:MAG: KAP family NTPase [Ruminococcus sp.]|uniref:hypothetical protein n=1 Tax=Ruminococcus sp. TaxID=41978 RepID=UPI0025F3299B|nr:hypothetical protein [Ruminococcus sp.]MCR5600128.1 KAP family NTPase [Ruminococcus sp.]
MPGNEKLYYEDIDEFIKNYVEEDKSGRAIMLTSGWGTGKSYYIKHELKDYLESHGYKCVIVSLYGLTDISEISKAIYVELRSLIKPSGSEAVNSFMVFGKTFVNGLISKVGIDFNKADKELLKVYRSVKLDKKFVIFEDVERTKIDLVELLGYVNGLCEGDNYKVMLVANENVIGKRYEYAHEKRKIIGILDEKYAQYQKAKEKTIGDTIRFNCNLEYTVKQILADFGIPSDEKYIKEIVNVMTDMKSYNMRSFQYACQKYSDIKKKLKPVYDLDAQIDKTLFHSIIAYIQLIDSGEKAVFKKDSPMSNALGENDKYHIFRFAYDYINRQRFDENEAKRQLENYSEYCRSSAWNKGTDEDLKVIKDFTVAEEKHLRDAIKNIPAKIENGEITYWDYCDLIASLLNIEVEYEGKIDSNYSAIFDLMIEKLKETDKKDEIKAQGLYKSVTVYSPLQEIYDDKIFEMEEALDYHGVLDAKSDPAMLEKLGGMKIVELKKRIGEEGFSNVFDVDDFCFMLENSSAKQLSIIFNILDGSYSYYDQDRILEDNEELITIRDKARTLKDSKEHDIIKKKWFEHIANNLEQVLSIEDSWNKIMREKKDSQDKVETEIKMLAKEEKPVNNEVDAEIKKLAESETPVC